MTELKKGTRIKNRYEIQSLLGKGGFGSTYKAVDHLLNRYVAIKCSDKSLAHEAEILKALNNVPYISHIYDYFVDHDNHYIVMRLVEGKSLSAYRQECGGTIPINVLKEMLPSALITLDQMHERGIIHRDISPGNYIISDDTILHLIDFGNATALKESGLKNRFNNRHLGLEAPEHSDVSMQGPWTDIYSLCTSIVYLLTGEGIPSPEDRTRYDALPGMLTGLSLTAKMQNAIMKGLSLEPKKRYQCINDFANDFFGRVISESALTDKYSVHYHARTDIGIRSVNQDNFMVDTKFAYAGEDCEIKGYIDCHNDEIHAVSIADGVASSNHGELASKAAIQAVSHFIDYYRGSDGLLQNMLEEFLTQLNEKIITLGNKIGKTASTISIMLWRNDEYCIANIGDSPIYKLSDGKLEQISLEQTLANEKHKAGIQTSVKDYHTLTAYLGKSDIAGSEMAYIKSGQIKQGDIFMLCSDGIGGVTTEAEKKKYMKKDGDKAIEKIFKCAHKHPYMDNCTAIILKF